MKKLSTPHDKLKLGIWLYLILLIFEGSLRKWFLPSLATPLLVIRDPIAIGVLIYGSYIGLITWNRYMIAFFAIGLLGLGAAMSLGHQNLPTAVYGARIFLFHVPFVFAIGKVFEREDVEQAGRFLLYCSILAAFLTFLQFYSPQSAWVNRGVGGDISGSGFSGAAGYLRPAGLFSFTNGNALFFSLAACFVIYFWFSDNLVKKSLLILATLSIFLAIPVSLSRGLVFQLALTLMATLFVIVRKPKFLNKLLVAGAAAIVTLAVLSFIPAFQTAMEVLSLRFMQASVSEGGLEGTLGDRFFGGLFSALANSTNHGIAGQGIGLGTNVGATFVSGGRGFLVAEEEWARNIGELGAIMGLMVVGMRISMSLTYAWRSYVNLSRGDILPWILNSFVFLNLMQGGWAQPTSLGFCIVAVGLLLASLKKPMSARSTDTKAASARSDRNHGRRLRKHHRREPDRHVEAPVTSPPPTPS